MGRRGPAERWASAVLSSVNRAGAWACGSSAGAPTSAAIAATTGTGHLFARDGAGRAIIAQRNSGDVTRGYVAFVAPEDWAAQAGFAGDAGCAPTSPSSTRAGLLSCGGTSPKAMPTSSAPSACCPLR
jgi:hypothetical protein